MSILNIIDQVAATSSRNEKESILASHRDNALLARVFKMAYDKQVLFWTQYIPALPDWGRDWVSYSLSDALDLLEYNICSRKITGNAARDYLDSLFRLVLDEDCEVLKRVILGDLRCGATSGTANKVWKGLIPVPKFMLAETDSRDIVYPAFSQMKEDGTRGKFTWDGSKVTILSRNGNEIETRGTFDAWAKRLGEGAILDGELVAFRNGKRLPRKESNGIVNKAVKGTISLEEAKMLVYVAWDVETMDAPYKLRYEQIEEWASVIDDLGDNSKVVAVESRVVENYDEALAHYKEARKRGLEGTILKNIAAKWQPKRTHDLVKFKAEYEGDFKVTGFEYGKKGTKNENRIGAIFVASADDSVKSDVGVFKDFPESIRDEWMNDMPKIVTVRYNERITKKKSTTESLYLPRVISARWDKDTANTRDELIEAEKNTLKD